MVECIYAIYENEVSECILYCFAEAQSTFNPVFLNTFLKSQFDVITVETRDDVRTTFMLCVTYEDETQKTITNAQLEENTAHTSTTIEKSSKGIVDECKGSVLGKAYFKQR